MDLPNTTSNGRRVIHLKYVPRNSAGSLVTHPIKGTLILREKPLETAFCAWSAEGVGDTVWNSSSNLDRSFVDFLSEDEDLREAMRTQPQWFGKREKFGLEG